MTATLSRQESIFSETHLGTLPSCDACIVLGHHPLDWLHDDHLGELRSILGQHHVIYLHGHLHNFRAQRWRWETLLKCSVWGSL
jgi:hypothetical protein